MFPSLRFMLAAVLSSLVILVIASSALISMRRPDMPMVLHPAGSRPLTASWQTDDIRSFDSRFGPQAMLVNASLQLPPVESAPPRPEFIATTPLSVAATKTIDTPAPAVAAAPEPIVTAAIAPVAPTAIEPPVIEQAAIEPTITVTPPVVVLPAPTADTAPAIVANVDASEMAAPKTDTNIVIAALERAPVPAKDPQVATDAPIQASQQTAAVLPAAPAASRPSFVDTSRPEPIVKPAIKRRAQIKRPKKRVVRAPVRVQAPVIRPAAPTNPFAALFGSSSTP